MVFVLCNPRGTYKAETPSKCTEVKEKKQQNTPKNLLNHSAEWEDQGWKLRMHSEKTSMATGSPRPLVTLKCDQVI